jgi:hypothetical protein
MDSSPLYKFYLFIETAISLLTFIVTIFLTITAFGPQNPNSSFGPEAVLIFFGIFVLPIAFLINTFIIVASNFGLFKRKLYLTFIIPTITAFLVGLGWSFQIELTNYALFGETTNKTLSEFLNSQSYTITLSTLFFGIFFSTIYYFIYILIRLIKSKTKISYYRFILPILCILTFIFFIFSSRYDNRDSKIALSILILLTSSSVFSIFPIALLELKRINTLQKK